MTQGEDALKRAFTPPEKWVRDVCGKTGADPEACLEERNEAAAAWTAFVGELANTPDALDVDVDPTPGQAASGAKVASQHGNIIQIAVVVYQAFGKKTLQRMLTVPQGVVEQVCKKSGADVQEVLAARNAATEELVEFVESLVQQGFTDPD